MSFLSLFKKSLAFQKSTTAARRPLPGRSVPAEVLEVRTMLAGNVTATLVDGVLSLSGDRRSNDLTVQIDSDGNVAFSSTGTTVNGQTAADVQLGGPVNSITGGFGRGRDRVVIEGVVLDTGDNADQLPTLSGGVSLNMGRGRDQLTVRGLDIDGDISLAGGRHRDQIMIEAIDAAGAVNVGGGRGRDTLATRNVTAAGDVNVSGGRGRDRFYMGENVTATGDVNVSGGRGRDRSVVVPEAPAAPTTETDAEAAVRAARTAVVDSVFAGALGGQIPEATLSAYNNSDNANSGGDGGSGNDGGGDGGDGGSDGGNTGDPNRTPAGSTTGNFEDAVFPPNFPDFDASQFQTSSTGLQFRIVDQGSSIMPAVTDSVTVNYQGVLRSDGSQFDSSYDRGQPATFGLQQVISGWTEGLQLVGEGGRIQLLIPPALAYGNSARPGIPPGSTLFFNVEVLDVN